MARFPIHRVRISNPPLPAHGLHQRPPMTQDRLSVHEGNKPYFLKFSFELPQFPHLRLEHIPSLDRRSKTCRDFPQIRGIATPNRLQDSVRGTVVCEQAVHDGAAKTERFSGLFGYVEAVVVTVESVRKE